MASDIYKTYITNPQDKAIEAVLGQAKVQYVNY